MQLHHLHSVSPVRCNIRFSLGTSHTSIQLRDVFAGTRTLSMLRLVTNLRRSVGVGHQLSHLCQHSSSGNVHAPSSQSWRRQHLVATNAQLVFARARLHHEAPVLCWRGLATTSTASEKPSGGGGFTAWYLRMLENYPLPTKCITAATILASADMTAQYLGNMTLKEGEAKHGWDKTRTMRMMGIGFFMSAPFLHMWFNVMQRIWPHSDVISTVKKVLAGQLLASPVVNSIFFAVNSFLQGETGEQAIEKIKRDLWPTWKSGAMYWPILDFITFRYIKIHFQVFFNNCCSFIWTIYLTSMAGKKAEDPSKH